MKSAFWAKKNIDKFSQIEAELNDQIKSIQAELDSIGTIRKDRAFEDEVTVEEEDLIQRRVMLQKLLVDIL
jgi:hypothetical protein